MDLLSEVAGKQILQLHALSSLMKPSILTLSAILPFTATALEFEKPILLKSGDKPIKTEAPGYASPALHDMNGDGKKDLLVGQFGGGKIMVYPGEGDGKFGKGTLLQAGGAAAKVPGVW